MQKLLYRHFMGNSSIKKTLQSICKQIRVSSLGLALFGSAILAFGLYQIHSISGITEGGMLGLTLLFHYWLKISPALSGFVLNVLCYAIGFRALGKMFLVYSIISSIGFSAFYALFECFPRIYPEIAQLPLVAALIGAVFIGLGAGLCVRVGGAPSGDDALAMAISAKSRLSIQWAYLISDLLVLGLSLSYIPATRLVYSLLTVVLSGQVIGIIQKIHPKKDDKR